MKLWDYYRNKVLLNWNNHYIKVFQSISQFNLEAKNVLMYLVNEFHIMLLTADIFVVSPSFRVYCHPAAACIHDGRRMFEDLST